MSTTGKLIQSRDDLLLPPLVWRKLQIVVPGGRRWPDNGRNDEVVRFTGLIANE